MCNHLMIGQGYLTNLDYKHSKNSRQWMNLQDISSQHLPTLGLRRYKILGKRLVVTSIDISKGSEGYIMKRFNIYESLNSIKTYTHTFILSYNFPTLQYGLEILDGLTSEYIRHGKLYGKEVIVIIKNLEETRSERYRI